MNAFPDMEWFRQLQTRANSDERLQKAARWFEGTIGWRVDVDTYTLSISAGQITAVNPEREVAVFIMAGKLEDWQELLAMGSINRLFRQNRLFIEGNKVEALRHWKMLWYLTEIARTI
jgi:hypothetical protein